MTTHPKHPARQHDTRSLPGSLGLAILIFVAITVISQCSPMNWFQEKIFYSVTIFLSSGCLWLGTILTVGDVRWLYATGAASLMTSGFVGLALRKDGDSIRILVSRTGIGFVGGVFGTKIILHWFSALDQLRIQSDADLILLSGIATLVSTVTHILGYAIIKSADDSAQNIASRLLDRLLMFFGITRPRDKTPLDPRLFARLPSPQ